MWAGDLQALPSQVARSGLLMTQYYGGLLVRTHVKQTLRSQMFPLLLLPFLCVAKRVNINILNPPHIPRFQSQRSLIS